MKILLVEDDRDLAGVVAKGLRQAHFAVDIAGTNNEAIEFLMVNQYDLVCLDLNLPDGDGVALCRKLLTDELLLRPRRILMLTARDAVTERVRGLDAGADDYLVKPFDLEELLARVRALTRRYEQSGETINILDLEIDINRYRVRRSDRDLKLSGKEFSVLRYLAHRADEVVSAEELLEHCWDSNVDSFTVSVRVILSRLRRKLGEPRIIHTIPGVGYRLCEDQS
jgi:DNA-binding response OmpR family regulator